MLEELNELNNLIIINNFAFEGCTSLKTLTGLNNVTHIYYLAFGNCISLESLYGLNQLIFIGNDVFKNCISLITLELNSYSSITFRDNCFDKHCRIDIIFDEITDDEIYQFNKLYPNINIIINSYLLK
jgi:hypothetical protein